MSDADIQFEQIIEECLASMARVKCPVEDYIAALHGLCSEALTAIAAAEETK